MRLPVVIAAVCIAASSCGATEHAAPSSPAAAAPSPTPASASVTSPAPALSTDDDAFTAAATLGFPSPGALRDALLSSARTLSGASGLEIQSPDVRDAGVRQQAAYRQLVEMPDWVAPVSRGLPATLIDALHANVEAGTELRAMTKPKDALPDWQIVPPPAAAELRQWYEEASVAHGPHWSYLAAIHLVETRMGRIRGTSTAGARGPMQFLPSTWARWGEGDIENPRDSIFAAARYLAGHGAPDRMDRALFAYNRSDRYVRAVGLYAERMRSDPSAFAGYYHWQVYYRTTRGDALLAEGWSR